MNVKIDGITAATDEFDVHDIVFHIRLAWDDEEHGFGLIDISQYRNGAVIDAEYMGREFVKKVLCTLVDEADMKDEK